MQIVVEEMPSPLGTLWIGASAGALCLLEFVDSRTLVDFQQTFVRGTVQVGRNAITERTAVQLAEYFAGKRRNFTVPLDFPGTSFQEKIWAALREIPFGETCSYEQLARSAGASPKACRAVGRANATNRIAIIIPCHRVVKKDGALSGYAGGTWRKQYLLDLERKGSH